METGMTQVQPVKITQAEQLTTQMEGLLDRLSGAGHQLYSCVNRLSVSVAPRETSDSPVFNDPDSGGFLDGLGFRLQRLETHVISIEESLARLQQAV